MSEPKGVLIYSELTEGKLASITAELLGCARMLADTLQEQVSVALMGNGVADFADETVSLGADNVYVADDASLNEYQTDVFLAVLENLIKKVAPRYILFGQTSTGRDLAPRLAFRLKTTVTTDCIDLEVDSQTRGLLQTKPVYGGNARATFSSSSFPQLVTVRKKAMSPLEPDASRKGEVISVSVSVDSTAVKAKVIDKIEEEVEGIKLEDAPVVICGGRGIGGPDGFKQLEELAKALKGALGASRPATDSGWVPAHLQVGLTGKVVTPDLYIGVGVSGASQHMAGCSGSKTIVAINKDPEANLLKEAQFGVVGDWKQVLPAFVEKIKELVSG